MSFTCWSDLENLHFSYCAFLEKNHYHVYKKGRLINIENRAIFIIPNIKLLSKKKIPFRE